MTVEYENLSTEGLIYQPREVRAAPNVFAKDVISFLGADRDFPELVGDVPNLKEFATGIDHNVGAFEIKAQDSRVVCVPENLAFLLPTTALIMDDLYATAGLDVADQCQVSLQFFRRDYEPAERLLFDQIHRHATEGRMVIYVVTAVDAGQRGDPHALGRSSTAKPSSARKSAACSARPRRRTSGSSSWTGASSPRPAARS